MKSFLKYVVGACLSVGLVATAAAGDKGTKSEAVALAQKAAAYYKTHGADKAWAAINDTKGQFVDRDMYVYVIDGNTSLSAHGANVRLVGKDLKQLKDADGKLFALELAELAKKQKSGWVDYKWPHPATKQIEAKTTYVEPAGGYGFAVGVYK